jgi:hypothetical protein
MAKWINKLLMLVAIATIVGHNSIPHYHHDKKEKFAHHDDDHHQGDQVHHHEEEQDTEDHHNIFSFAQLDDDFLPSPFGKYTIDLPILYLITPFITYQINKLIEQSTSHFGYYREFPPPDNYLSELPSRGPPSFSNMA